MRDQYAAVGCAATVSLSSASELLTKTSKLNADNQPLLEKYCSREKSIEKYRDAYRVYEPVSDDTRRKRDFMVERLMQHLGDLERLRSTDKGINQS